MVLHRRLSVMNIVIIEDNKQILRNTRILLEREPGVTVSGAFGTAEAALEAMPHISPNIMLTDIGLPGMSGIELIAIVKKERPDLEILAYTAQSDRDVLLAVLKAGASGYILKGCKARELIEALYSIREGGAPMSPQISRAVVCEFHNPSAKELHLLTSREKEIVAVLEKGLSYKGIAESLSISVNTVHTHISKIFKKLGAENRRDALVKARIMGIV